MSSTIKHTCFTQKGNLTSDIIKEHVVPSLGIGATETIKKAGWNGNTASFAVGLAIGPTGDCVRSARAFGVGHHDNCWTIASSKVWGSKEGYKIAINLKDMTTLSFPSNTTYTNYIDSTDIAWYAYNKEGEKTKLRASEHADAGIKKFCIRASVELVNAKTASICYAIVPVSLEELKKEYLEHFDKPGFPTILFQTKEIPFTPLSEEDWELPSPVMPLFLDERTPDNQDIFPNGDEVWEKFAKFLRTCSSPNVLKDYDEWVRVLSDNPRFQAYECDAIWPLPIPKSSSNSGESCSSFEQYCSIPGNALTAQKSWCSLSRMPTGLDCIETLAPLAPTGLDSYQDTGMRVLILIKTLTP